MVKYNFDGLIQIYKVRIVEKGYTQMYEIDYDETFALVAKFNIISCTSIKP